MKTVIEFTSGVQATFNNGDIACEDADYLTEAEAAVAGLLESPSIPDLDRWRAGLACEATGAKIVQYDGPPTDQTEGEIY